MSLTIQEYKRSVHHARKKLRGLPEPSDEWVALNQRLLFFDLVIDDLKERKVITLGQEKEMRMMLRPMSVKCILNSPHLRDDEEKRKRVLTLLLIEELRTRLDKDVAVFYCEKEARL